ncbi:hypothetical protein PIB30_033721 [Stylosanthes scabra]|uniref:Terpene synthase metal-binding domain-containing protein n=1 Tax=Stylosanthes scabra TaxID=79078 RepID=A0ABU6YBF4_9FABA|nr:hypothetical protein [Stylosanthes scabra]
MSDVGGPDPFKSGLFSSWVKRFYAVAHGYFVEAKWCHEGRIPTYEEYKANGVYTSAYPTLLAVFISLVEEFATKAMLDWISKIPAILEATCIIGRILNDMASHKFEQERKHVASAVECCMKQYGFSQEEAYEFINKDINHYWKNLNAEYLKLIKDIPEPVIDFIVNLARASEFMYANFEDKYTNCELLNDYIVALFLDPIDM